MTTRVIPDRINEAIVKSIFYGIKVRNHSGTPASTLIISSGVAAQTYDGASVITTTDDITMAITASGENGLDDGSEAANTWYYIWLIRKVDRTVAGLFSASSTAPVMPSGYTEKAIIGAVRNDASSNFLRFWQFNRRIMYRDAGLVYSGNPPSSFTAVDPSSFVPVAIAPKAFLTFYGHENTTEYVYVAPGTQSASTGGILALAVEDESEMSTTHLELILGSDNMFSVRGTGWSNNITCSVYGFELY